MKGWNRDTDVEDRHVNMEEGEGGPNMEVRIDTCTLPCRWEPAIKHRKLSLVLCDDLDGRD